MEWRKQTFLIFHFLIIENLIIMKEQQARKNCQAFMAKLQNSQFYENVK